MNTQHPYELYKHARPDAFALGQTTGEEAVRTTVYTGHLGQALYACMGRVAELAPEPEAQLGDDSVAHLAFYHGADQALMKGLTPLIDAEVGVAA